MLIFLVLTVSLVSEIKAIELNKTSIESDAKEYNSIKDDLEYKGSKVLFDGIDPNDSNSKSISDKNVILNGNTRVNDNRKDSRALQACLPSCASCTDSTISCSSCSYTGSGTACMCSSNCVSCSDLYFLVQHLCVPVCPTGYSNNVVSCDLVNSNFIFYLNLDTIEPTVTDSKSSFPVTTGPDSSFYPSYATGDPYAAIHRGYYFTGSSYMQGPPVSQSGTYITLAPQFTITAWINPTSSNGMIMTKQSSTYTEYFSIYLVNGVLTVNIFLATPNNVYTMPGTLVNTNAWNFIAVQTYISSTQYTVGITVNSTLTNNNIPASYWFMDNNTFTTFGASISGASSFNSYYTGFIYEISIYNDVETISSLVSTSCTGGCSYCPIKTNACLANCPINSYWTGSKCSLCKGSCKTTGCAKFDTACNLCRDPLCSVCTGYASLCTTCKSNTSISNGVCSCAPGYAYDSVSGSCLACTTGCSTCSLSTPIACTACSPMYYLIGSACLSYSPTGYSSGSLDSNAGYIFYILLNKIQDTVVDSKYNLKATTGVDTSFYPSYQPSDPLANPRGYYFTGSSYMSLPPNYADSTSSIIFSPILTISTWIRYTNPGTILNKQLNSSPYTSSIKLGLTGQNPTISILLTTSVGTSTTSYTCLTALNTTSWHQVAFTLTVSDATYVNCIIDGTPEGSVFIGNYLLIDYTSNFVINIGADYGAAYSNYFTGFIYSIKFWNVNVDPAALDLQSCNGCWICPISGCPSNCDIDQYWDGSACQFCKSSCAATGCVRADTKCNMCGSLLCELCTDYTSCGATSSCIANASPSPCACNAGKYFDSTEEACITCPSVCGSCTSSSSIGCTSCAVNTYTLLGLCRYLCPSGYTISGAACSAGTTLFLSLTFNQITGTITDSSPLGSVAVTGSSSNFYPNYDTNDPFAAYMRGYYFNGINSVVNLPPFSTNTSPILYVGPQVTIDAWIYPTSSSGTIITKQDITTFSSLYMLSISSGSLQLTAYYENLGVYTHTCPLALTLNSWSYIGYSVNFASSSSIITCYINTVSSSPTTIGSGYIDDTTSLYKLIIGTIYVTASTYTSYYKGFLYFISIDNSFKTPTSYVSSGCTYGCSLCPVGGICLASCDINKYWTGSAYNSCGNCNSNCLNVGCRDSGYSCTLCSDIKCSSCTTYTSGSCTACKTNANTISGCSCNPGYYWDTTYESCNSCYFTCGTCSSLGFMNCNTCRSGYVLLNGACHPYCPTGLTSSGSGCSIVNNPAFNIKPLTIQGVVTDTVGSIPVVTGSTSTFYPNFELNDPYPLKDRGYYFAGTSIMKLPPSAQYPTPLFLFGNTFMITAWVYHISDGVFLSTQPSNFSDTLKITMSLQPILSIILQDTGTTYSYTCTNLLGSYWNFVAFQIQLISGNTIVSCIINTATSSTTLGYGYYIGSNSYFTIGARASTSTSYTSFWTGQLYSLSFYNTYSVIAETTNACIATPFVCTLCPASTGTCINQCLYNTYWDGTTCSNCNAGCNSCVRPDSTCNLCYNQACSVCTDYSLGSCTTCKSYSTLSSGQCTCYQFYYLNTVTEACTSCNPACNVCTGSNYLDCSSCNTGYYWFYDICLSSCPSGYTANSATKNCDMNYQQVFNISFDTISGQPADSSPSTILTRAGSSASFYPSYTSDDPYASYMRGYYFNGASKVYMPPYPGNTLPVLILAPDITINAWVRPSSDGAIISHQNYAVGVSVYFSIQILSSKAVLSINLFSSGLVQTSSTNALPLNTWSHIGFTVSVGKSVGTTVTSYINGVQNRQNLYSLDYFPAPINNFLWTIGAKYSTVSTFSNYFTGYIYNIVIWNAVVPTAAWSTSSTCTANPTPCTICPNITNKCLPDCDLNQYYDDVGMVCGPCKSTCNTGCRNATYCNLCYDPICSSCSSVYSGSCVYCKANAGFSGSACSCGTNYLWYGVQETCSSCYNGCTVCASPIHNTCITCSNSYYLVYNECINFCPYQFVNTTGTCSLPSGANIKVFMLNLANVILGQVADSINSFNVLGGSSLNFYPTYDSKDPYAADVRGYYFTGSSFMTIQTSPTGLLNFPPRLTIGMWVNYISDGVLLSKQSILDVTKKPIEFMIASGKLYLNMLLTQGQYSATSTLTVANNTWSYLSYQLNILANGTSQITFFVNGVSDTPILLGVDYFIDFSTSFSFLIGAEYISSGTLGNYFTGFVWRISMWQDLVSDYSQEYSTACTGCSVCTPSSSCLSLCSVSTFAPSCTACPACTPATTCVSAASCNLCYDLLCYSCNNYTSAGCVQCITNAGFVSGLPGTPCGCNSGYSWNSVTQTCDQCANLCSPCTSLQTTGCSGCFPGDYFHQTVCMPWCPTGFIPGSTTCSGNPGLVFHTSLLAIQGVVTDSVSGNIQVVTGTSSTFYPTYESQDPYAIASRGYYFNGLTSYMSFVPNSNNNKQMVISPLSTIGMWVYPLQYSAILLSKKTAGMADYLKFGIDSNGHPIVSILLKLLPTIYNYTSPQTVALNSWNHIGYGVNITNNYTLITCYLNGVPDANYYVDKGHYEDLINSYLFSIGAYFTTTTTLTNYFKGYINDIKIWNTYYNLASEVGTCTGCVCPSSTGVCISTCSLNQYIAQGCQNCNSACTTGCVRGSDCNLCYDVLCSICTDFTSQGCTSCITNANLLTSKACQCKTGTYLDSTTSTCPSCFPYCANCTSPKNGDCSACTSLSYLNPEPGVCLTSCPAGYNPSSNLCNILIPANSMVVHFVFDRLTNEVQDSVSGYYAFMGSTSNYLGNFDSNDPYPVYSRGVYFTGNSYVSLPPNPKDVSSIILGNTHSVSLWARPQSYSSNHYLMSKEDGTNLRASIYIDKTTFIPYAVYRVFSDTTNAASVITAVGPAIPAWDTWNEIAVVLTRTGYSTELTLYVNGVPGAISSLPNTFFHDVTSNTFKLGYSQVMGAHMKGFIYEIRIYNYNKIFSVPSASCGCSACTQDGACLSSCGYLYYIDSTCKLCSSACTTGCVNGNNCYLNLDKLCLNATGFLPSQCTNCISLASGAGNGCQCGANAGYNASTDACACNFGYTLYNNLCVPCYYPIQSTNIQGYFSADYLSLVFNLTIPVQSTTTSLCVNLFDSVSYGMLGSSPKCTWNANMNNLNVLLGPGATVLQSPITFNSKTLYTNVADCTTQPNSVTVDIQFLYPKPSVTPIPWLLAPLQTYIKCDDLFLDASKSTGGFNRPLTYEWIFVSNPKILALSGYEQPSANNTQLFFSRTSLSASTVALTVIVSNWLGNSASITQQISIVSGQGLHLVLDGNTKWVMSTSDDKTIFIQATSSCTYSSSLSYSWGITSMTGAYSAVDRSTLTKSQTVQSIIYIPPYVLKPGTYVFQVNITDNAYSMSGSTQFSITIVSQSLVIVLPGTYLTVPTNVTNTVSAQQSYDPDRLSGNIKYNWVCSSSSGNCNNLILDPSASILTINTGLVSGNLYYFNLTIYKDIRSSWSVITLAAASFLPPSVEFSLDGSYVNSELPVSIQATVTGTGPYQYLWSLESGGAYQASTLLNATEIGFNANSLSQGTTYVFRFQVLSGTDLSIFKVQFPVRQLPNAGTLAITPTIGTEASTVFELQALGWVDPDYPDTGILTYQFGYNLNNQAINLNIRNQSSFFYTSLPYSPSPLVVWVKVINDLGGYTLSTTTVAIIKSNLDLSAQSQAALSNTLNNDLSNPAELPGLISRVCIYYLSNSSISSADKDSEYANSILPGIDTIIANTVSYKNQDIESILSTISVLTNAYQPESPDTIISRLYALLDLSVTAGVTIDTKQVGYYTNIIEKASGFNVSMIENNSNAIDNVNNGLTNVLAAAAKTMVNGQSITYQTSKIHLISTLYSSVNFTNYTSPSIPGYSGSVMIPELVSISTYPILSVFILYDDKGASLANSSLPTAIDFSLIEITPSGNTTLSLSFSSPLVVNIPIYNYTTGTLECVYMDSQWSSYGCSYISYTKGIVTCTSNHTSLFSAGINLVPYVPPPPAPIKPKVVDTSNSYIIFYYLCGLVGLWIVISSVFIIIDQNESVHRKNAEKLANERFFKWYKSEEPVEKISNEKKLNETVSVDQNPTFFKKSYKNPDIVTEAAPLESNPFLKVMEREPAKTVNLSYITGKQEVSQEVDENYLKPSGNPFTLNYFVSFFLFYEPHYSRFVRILVLFVSLCVQVFIIGIVIYEFGSVLSLPDAGDLSTVLSDLTYMGGITSLVSSLIGNVLAFLLQFLMKNSIMVYQAGQERLKTRSKIWKILGMIISIGIVGFVVYSGYYLSSLIYTPHTCVWFYLIVISLLSDLIIVQTIKVISMRFVRPSNRNRTVVPDANSVQ